MVWGAIASAAVAVGVGLYNAYKSGRIDKNTYEAQKRAIEELERNWQLPPGEAQPITFEQMKVLQQYAPEIPQMIQETRPELITEATSAPQIRAQNDAMAKYAQFASVGDDAISKANREQVGFEADARTKSSRQNVMQEFARRGLLGTNEQLLGELQATDGIASNARQASLQAQSQAEERRRAALGQMSNLATQVRGQNQTTERANIDILNAFNRRATEGANTYAKQVAEQRNEAQLKNLQANQSALDANTTMANRYSQLNTERGEQALKDRSDSQKYLNELRFRGQTGLATDGGAVASAAHQNNMGNFATAANAGAGIAGAYSARDRQAKDDDFRQQELDIKRGKNLTDVSMDDEEEIDFKTDKTRGL